MTEEWRKEKVDYVVYNAISYAFERAVKETLGAGAPILQTTMVPLVGVDLISATEKELGIEFKPGKPTPKFIGDLAKMLVRLGVADEIHRIPDTDGKKVRCPQKKLHQHTRAQISAREGNYFVRSLPSWILGSVGSQKGLWRGIPDTNNQRNSRTRGLRGDL